MLQTGRNIGSSSPLTLCSASDETGHIYTGLPSLFYIILFSRVHIYVVQFPMCGLDFLGESRDGLYPCLLITLPPQPGSCISLESVGYILFPFFLFSGFHWLLPVCHVFSLDMYDVWLFLLMYNYGIQTCCIVKKKSFYIL